MDAPSSYTYILSAATSGLILFWLIKKYFDSKRFHNGPWGFPIIGHLPLLTSQPHLKFTQWAEQFGSVYRIRMGSRFTVVINGYEAVKEALVTRSDDFSDRPNFYTFEVTSEGKSLTFGRYGTHWKLHRSIARNALAMFTQKRRPYLEGHVVDEADIIIEDLTKENGPIDPKESMHVATTSIVFSICYDEGFNIREDEGFLNLLRNSSEFGKIVGAGGNPVDVMPWTLPFFKKRMKTFTSLVKEFDRLNNVCHERLRKAWTAKEPRNLSDALFDVEAEMSEEQLIANDLSVEHIRAITTDVLGAGQVTIVSFLYWALRYMVEFPEVQKRVHEEIDQHLGFAKSPSYEDRLHMPYCEAVFYETMRCSVFVPFLIPHATTRDCKFRGHDIPQGSLVFCNMHSFMHDESIWENPSKFDPMRFIDPSSGTLDRNKSEHVMMFGMGKRRCLGEFLARLESFIFFVRLLQRCEFSKVPGDSYNLKVSFGLTMDPERYRLLVNPRN